MKNNRKILAMACFVGAALCNTGCPKAKFAGGGGSGSNPIPQGSPQKSPPEIDANARKKICAESHKATRIAFVVDNSGSHGLKEGTVQDGSAGFYTGTDPVRKGTSARGREETFTDRQNVLFDVITRTAALDAEALKKNPEFLGSEVGVAYFPDGDKAEGIEQHVKISGTPPLPAAMTNLKNISLTDGFKNALWDRFAFTHTPSGTTPYTNALTSARDLLKNGRDAADPRPDVVVILSDGLPSDEQPSRVLEARKQIDDLTPILLFALYSAAKDPDIKKSKDWISLYDGFRSDAPTQKWARKPGRTDGYQNSDAEFDRYWNDLQALPEKIVKPNGRIVEVSGSTNLKEEVEKILSVVQTCQ